MDIFYLHDLTCLSALLIWRRVYFKEFIMTSGSDTVGKRFFFFFFFFLWRIICQSDLANDALSKITFSSLFSVLLWDYLASTIGSRFQLFARVRSLWPISTKWQQRSAFRGTCTQDHDLICNRCEDLKAVLSDTQKSIQESCFGCQYDKEDALHRFQEATRAIQLWKSHQLRLVNQDNAHTDVIECLDDSKVLLVQDWAMKFLLRQYRESQGIYWHINEVIRKKESKLETQAFVHVVEKCIQDSPCVV